MRILIADADDFEARIYVRAFAASAVEADVVDSGEACLAEARLRLPDGILLDLLLPRRDGFSILEDLRSNEATARIPVAVFARAAKPEDIVRSSRFGACPFFIKRFVSPAAIAKRVKAFVSFG
jgi:DNA-binding response OmpR family regulator